MGKLGKVLANLKEKGKKSIIPYVMAGLPSLEESLMIVFELQKIGASAIEIGIPFSDPMADGPVIQRAHATALKNGITLLDTIRAIREKSNIWRVPLILMTYYNLVFRMGEETLAREAKEAGISGVIIPDLPPEEADGWLKASRRYGIDTVFLVAPNTPLERVKKIASVTTGFLYYISLKGVTGLKIHDMEEVKVRLIQIKSSARLPVCVGFGIKKPWEVKTILKDADGVVIGSVLLEAFERGGIPLMLDTFAELKCSLP